MPLGGVFMPFGRGLILHIETKTVLPHFFKLFHLQQFRGFRVGLGFVLEKETFYWFFYQIWAVGRATKINFLNL